MISRCCGCSRCSSWRRRCCRNQRRQFHNMRRWRWWRRRWWRRRGCDAAGGGVGGHRPLVASATWIQECCFSDDVWVSLEFFEQTGKEVRIAVDPQHPVAHVDDDPDALVPEPLPVIVGRDERSDRIADLISHVRVGQVEAGEHRRLEILDRDDVRVDGVSHHHIEEDDVRWVEERYLLPTVGHEGTVNGPYPADRLWTPEVT